MSSVPNWFEVSDPAVAKALLDYDRLRLLEPFFAAEIGVAEAARALAIDIRTLHYHVGRFEAMGLLEVIRREPRKGRAIKLYRAVAAALFVPFRHAPPKLLEDFVAAFSEPVRRQLAGGLTNALFAAIPDLHRWGMAIVHEPGEGLQYFPAPGPAQTDLFTRQRTDPSLPVASDRWRYLDLDPRDAREFERELTELLERYRGRGGAQRYLTHLAIAPVER